MKKRIRLQGLLIFLSAVLTVFLMFAAQKLIFVQWKKEGLDEFADLAGIVLICLGYFIRLTARAYKSRQSLNSHKLVMDGIYEYVRNPMYLGSFIAGTGVVVTLFQPWILVVLTVIFAVIYQLQTGEEEAFLQKKFGNEYMTYKSRTPKYFPCRAFAFLTRLFREIPFQWQSIKSELQSFCVIVFVVTFFAAWQDALLFGNQEFVKEFLEFIYAFVGIISIVFILNKVFVRDNKKESGLS